VHTRREGRFVALQALYWVESTADPVELAVNELAGREGLSQGLTDFTLDLCRKVVDNRERFNEMISGVALNWDISRISRVDRIALWIGLAELFCSDDVPPKVAISEAIELARAFSGEKAAGFVNGILDAIAKKEGIIEGADRSPGG